MRDAFTPTLRHRSGAYVCTGPIGLPKTSQAAGRPRDGDWVSSVATSSLVRCVRLGHGISPLLRDAGHQPAFPLRACLRVMDSTYLLATRLACLWRWICRWLASGCGHGCASRGAHVEAMHSRLVFVDRGLRWWLLLRCGVVSTLGTW